MHTAPRDQPFDARFDSSTLHAQSEQARRYLRRRREVLLCVLVSLLGVLVARSIPLTAHEADVCACREALHARDLRGRVRVVARGLTPLHTTGGLEGPVDLVVAAEGAWLFTPDARVLLADRCDEVTP